MPRPTRPPKRLTDEQLRMIFGDNYERESLPKNSGFQSMSRIRITDKKPENSEGMDNPGGSPGRLSTLEMKLKKMTDNNKKNKRKNIIQTLAGSVAAARD